MVENAVMPEQQSWWVLAQKMQPWSHLKTNSWLPISGLESPLHGEARRLPKRHEMTHQLQQPAQDPHLRPTYLFAVKFLRMSG